MTRGKRKINLEKAIISLRNLLEGKQNNEKRYQVFFGKNPIVFDVLGYKNFWAFTKESKNSLPMDRFTGKKPEPDFIVERKDGLFEIFELKTPVSKNILVTSNKYRERFTSEVSSYISQTIDYHNYFKNPLNRSKVNKMLGVNIQENLNIKIIIGLRKDLYFKEIDKHIKSYSCRIEITPFDNILDQLIESYGKEFGYYEDLLGISFHSIVRFHDSSKTGKKYFFVVGDKNADNISIFMENNELYVEFKPKKGRIYIRSISNIKNLLLSKWSYFSFELGIKDKTIFFSINLNNKEISREETTFENKININFNNCVLGCSINQKNFGFFDDYEKCVYSRTLKVEEKYQLFKYLSKRIKKIKQFIQFDGSKFMYRDSETGNFIQNDPKYKPIFRKI